jgi:hypothetical protein
LFSPGTPVFFTNKADPHVIAEILLKVVLKIMTIPLTWCIEYTSPSTGCELTTGGGSSFSGEID